MKGIKLLLLSLLIVTSLSLVAQDTTITYKFNNFMVVDGTPRDTLIFDIEAKSNVTGTYLWGSQIVLQFNTSVFGINISGSTILQKLELAQPGNSNYLVIKSNTGSGTKLLINIYQLIPVTIANLSEVQTDFVGLLRVKMQIYTPGANAGVQFDPTLMGFPRQKYVLPKHDGLNFSGIAYDVVYYYNNLLNIPTNVFTNLKLLISEVGTPSNSNAKFVEIYNAGTSTVDFGIYPWYLTCETDGTGAYANIQLTGTLATGAKYVIGNSASDFNTAYGGKNATQYSSSVITGNGNDSYFLNSYGDYTDGTSMLIDIYGQAGTNGTGQDWEYTNSHAVRHYSVTAPITTWTKAQWCIAPAQNIDMTPGSHHATLDWTATAARSTEWRDTSNWTSKYVPDAGHNVLIPTTATIFPHITSGDNGYCNNLDIQGGGGGGGLVIESAVGGDGSLITYGTVTGTAQVQRYLGADRYWYVSQPVTSAVANVFLHCWLYTYNEPTSAWGEWIVPETTPLAVMKGYATWTSSINPWHIGWTPLGDTTTSYWGVLNTGNLSTSLTATGDGWNFTGNPYVSALDWVSTGITKTNLFTNAYYVWNGDNNTYASYVVGTGGNNGGTQYIPAAQGFFVKSASGGGNLGVSNAARAHNSLAFWKSGEESVANLLSLTVNNSQVSDETIIHFDENATVDVDYNYDAPKFFATVSAQLFTMAGSDKMAINTFNNTTQTSAVDMGLIVPESGEYTISASNIESFDAGTPIFMEDLALNKVINLRSTNSYTFTSSPQDNPMRFVIHFTEMQGIDDPQPEEVSSIYSYHRDVYVNYNGIKGEIIIYNVLGQEIIRQAAMNGLNKITLEKGNSAYVVKVIGEQTTVSRKVFIQ